MALQSMRTLTCELCSGDFTVPVKRGRVPRKHPGGCPTTRQAPEASRTRIPLSTPDTYSAPTLRQAESVPEPSGEANPSLPLAKRAKTDLEAQGWTVQGKASGTTAEITGSRGDELLYARWDDGELTQPMEYTLWSNEQPKRNGRMPKRTLPFDPDEITDRELVSFLRGMSVTWFNRLAQATETATIGKEKFSIEHVFDSRGEEMPQDRIVKFIEHGGSGYRAFRLGALLKVGR